MNYIDLARELSALPKAPLAQSKAWLSKDIAEHDWLLRFDRAALSELDAMVDQMRKQPLPDVLRTPDEFRIPRLRELFAQAARILSDGVGFVVFDRLPMDEISEREAVAVFWTLGQLFGMPVAQKWDGTVIYDVTDTGKQWQYGVRGSATNVELVFHTDNAFGTLVPEVVGLLCKYPALEGGLSRFCSLYTLHNRLLEQCPALLERLYQPMLFDRQAEHHEAEPKTSFAPFFTVRHGKLAARINVSLVRKGYQVAGEEMDRTLVLALQAVEQISASGDIWYEAPIERGQMQYLNNHELGHYRSEFRDHPDPELKRHLFRTWHRSTGKRTYDGH